MLMGDGSPTRHLQLLTGQRVEVELIGMEPETLPSSQRLHEVTELNGPLVRRQVWLRSHAMGLGQLNAAADGHRLGDAVRKEDLIQPQMEQPAQRWRLLVSGTGAAMVQPAIQQAPLANAAVGQLRRQGTVRCTQLVAVPPELPRQGHVGKGAGGHTPEHLPGHLTGQGHIRARRFIPIQGSTTAGVMGRDKSRSQRRTPSHDRAG
ncbi:MAG: DUF98 domain-containing protein [Synechococcus sp. SB0668_bin_15]|nr:DUF98 domain-containing protein [Synechococcus sp. SB0668_bin_15]MXZ82959.1 DUF98 domain-containing protein [Synechococcus sp. SB0666_bin_14]MYA90704.1 DUF98 domain-containing protein [Synechococcus sp. SB0663_bin_10]MYC49634.1 DUF98 domain-containing protein [Synechococcus sp. SB0662_bin_14]MYG47403.1 DUF98 domain-containing protein [Synechococcus sp. SB0675_bin_6]